MSSPHGSNHRLIRRDANIGAGDVSDVPKLIENTIKGLLYLVEHIEFLQLSEYWEQEIAHILSLAEELDRKLETIVEKETESSGNGESLKY